jgi:hypothetical protein
MTSAQRSPLALPWRPYRIPAPPSRSSTGAGSSRKDHFTPPYREVISDRRYGSMRSRIRSSSSVQSVCVNETRIIEPFGPHMPCGTHRNHVRSWLSGLTSGTKPLGPNPGKNSSSIVMGRTSQAYTPCGGSSTTTRSSPFHASGVYWPRS